MSDVELFEKAEWDGLEMRVAVNERDIPDRGGCGNEGVHRGEAFLYKTAELSRRWVTVGLHEFFGALRDQFGDRALPLGEKMAAAPSKRLDRLLAGGERSGSEFPGGIQEPLQSRSR